MPIALHGDGFGLGSERLDRKPRSPIPIQHGDLFVSEVVDAFAHLGVVHVNAAGSGVIIGIVASQSGNGIIGPRKIGGAFPVHSKVICYRPSGSFFAYVLGSVPDWILSPGFNRVPDWIVPASLSGWMSDRVHRGITERPNGLSGLFNCAAGRPMDELPGDHGYLNELGVGYGMGKLMAWLRASHFCGVEAFWADNLLRLIAYNYEMFGAANETRAVDDEGEWSRTDRWSPYPWETRGVYTPETDFTTTGSSDAASGKAALEPVHDDQAGVWRVSRLRGYLGDLDRTIVSVPTEWAGAARSSGSDVHPGVAETSIGIDGAIRVRSARRVLLEKTLDIVVPMEKAAPDDPLGDTANDYRSAGRFGSGPSHVRNEPPADEFAGLRSLLARDRHAMLDAVANLSLVRHVKDYRVPTSQESAAKIGVTVDYSPVETPDPAEFWLPLPESASVQVDHRGSARYYSGRAFVELDELGNVFMEDAFGAQIRMEGGAIFISAREIVLQSGRNTQIWSGRDSIIKAHHAVDVSAANGDVRVKASRNMMLSSTQRGVLIESGFDPNLHSADEDWSGVGEEVVSRGVTIKATYSPVSVLGLDLYMRSGVADKTRSQSRIDIDAGGGDGGLFLHGGEVTTRAGTRSQTIVGSNGENDLTASMDMTATEFIIGGRFLTRMTFGASRFAFANEEGSSTFYVDGSAVFGNNVLVRENVIVDGSVQSGGSGVFQESLQVGGSVLVTGTIICANIAADSGGGFLPRTSDQFQAANQSPAAHPPIALEQSESESAAARDMLTNARIDDNAAVMEIVDHLYADAAIGNSQTLAEKRFTFRTPSQYRTESDRFQWPEARWQFMSRETFGVFIPWREEEVHGTMPYPGLETWRKAVFVRCPAPTLRNADGSVRDWDEVLDGALPTPERTTFESGYGVVEQEE